MAFFRSGISARLQEYTKILPDIYEREAMEKEFFGESDRACGILFASSVELMVERAIKLRLTRQSSLFDLRRFV